MPPEKQAPAQRDPKRSHRRRQDSHRHTAGQGSHRHTGSHRHKSSHHRHTAGAGIPRVRTREAAPAGPSGPDTTAAAAGDDVVMKEAEPGTGSGGVNPGASTLEGTEQATTATTGGAQAQSGSHSHHHGTRRNVRSRYSNPEQGSGVSTAPPPSGLGAPPPPPPPPSQPAPAPPKAPRPPPEPAAATEPRQQQHPPLAQLLPQLQSCVLRRLVEVKFLDRRATWVVSDTETAELDRVAACALSASSPGFRPVLCQCDDCLELSQACHMVKRKREVRAWACVCRFRIYSSSCCGGEVGLAGRTRPLSFTLATYADAMRAPLLLPPPKQTPLLLPSPMQAPLLLPSPMRAPLLLPSPMRAPPLMRALACSLPPPPPLPARLGPKSCAAGCSAVLTTWHTWAWRTRVCCGTGSSTCVWSTSRQRGLAGGGPGEGPPPLLPSSGIPNRHTDTDMVCPEQAWLGARGCGASKGSCVCP